MERITKEFLQGVFPDCKINNHKVSDAVAPGDNFMSLTYRVEVELKCPEKGITERHLIVKLQPNNAVRRERLGTGTAFCNEVLVYKRILPAFVSFAKGKGIESPLSSFPKCLGGFADGSVNDFLVLEDLAPLGFKMLEKRKGFGFRECELVMKALGEFHAFSFAMKQENSEGFLALRRKLDELWFRPERETIMSSWLTYCVDLALQAFKSKNPDTVLTERIAKLKIESFSKVLELIQPIEPMSVITHGDCWVNNLLVSHNTEGEVTEVKLIDLQISRYASPSIDLQYFFCTSTTKSIRENHLKHLLKVYHGSLSDTLEVLGSKQDIPLSDVEKDFSDHSLYGLYMAMELLPHVLVDSQSMPNLEGKTEDDDLSRQRRREERRAALTTEYEERMSDLLTEYISAGII